MRLTLMPATAMVLAALLPAAPQAAAEAWTARGGLRELEGGWAQNTMSVQHPAAVVNPAACPNAHVGYATDPKDTGANLFHSMLMSALLNRLEVKLLIDGCVFQKPRIIAVAVR
jgi:hypothetical protein